MKTHKQKAKIILRYFGNHLTITAEFYHFLFENPQKKWIKSLYNCITCPIEDLPLHQNENPYVIMVVKKRLEPDG